MAVYSEVITALFVCGHVKKPLEIFNAYIFFIKHVTQCLISCIIKNICFIFAYKVLICASNLQGNLRAWSKSILITISCVFQSLHGSLNVSFHIICLSLRVTNMVFFIDKILSVIQCSNKSLIPSFLIISVTIITVIATYFVLKRICFADCSF